MDSETLGVKSLVDLKHVKAAPPDFETLYWDWHRAEKGSAGSAYLVYAIRCPTMTARLMRQVMLSANRDWRSGLNRHGVSCSVALYEVATSTERTLHLWLSNPAEAMRTLLIRGYQRGRIAEKSAWKAEWVGVAVQSATRYERAQWMVDLQLLLVLVFEHW